MGKVKNYKRNRKKKNLKDQTGFPKGLSGEELSCQAGDGDLIPGSGRSPGGGKWPATLVFLPRESHGQSSQTGYSPWGRKELGTTY